MSLLKPTIVKNSYVLPVKTSWTKIETLSIPKLDLSEKIRKKVTKYGKTEHHFAT